MLIWWFGAGRLALFVLGKDMFSNGEDFFLKSQRRTYLIFFFFFESQVGRS